MRRAVAVLVTSAAVATVGAPTAIAGGGNPSPTGTGPPMQECQAVPGFNNNLPSVGAGSAPGSVFNEKGFGNNSPGGTGGAAYNAANAPSQYDVACYQTSIH